MANIRIPFSQLGLQPSNARAGMISVQGFNYATPSLDAAVSIGGAISAAGGAVTQIAVQEREIDLRDRTARARADVVRALPDIEDEARQSGITDPQQGQTWFRDRFSRAMTETAERNGLRGQDAQLWQAQMQDLAAAREVGFTLNLRERANQQRVADAQTQIDEAATAAAAARNPLERQILLDGAQTRIAELERAGAVNPLQARQLRDRFDTQISVARVTTALARNPGEALRLLNDPAETPGLDADRRAAMTLQVLNRQDSMAARAEAAAARRDATLFRSQQRAADRLLNQFYGALDAGQRGEGAMPSREDLDRFRDFLSPGEYRAAVQALRNPAERDAPSTVATLQAQVHSLPPDEFRTQAARAMGRGELRVETFRSMVQQNEAARRDDMPASAFRSGRAFVSDGLDPGNVVGGEFLRGPLATARQNALADFDRWFEQNQGATRGETIDRAREIVARYQQGAQAQSRLSLPRPFSFQGERSGITPDVLRGAANALLEAQRAGRISALDLVREQQILDAWMSLLPPPAPRNQQQQPPARGQGPATR